MQIYPIDMEGLTWARDIHVGSVEEQGNVVTCRIIVRYSFLPVSSTAVILQNVILLSSCHYVFIYMHSQEAHHSIFLP